MTDDKIDLAKVPAKVKEAASKALPKAKWTGASKSEEDGKVTYELEGEDAAKHYVWVELTADAKVNEVGSEIAFGAVPQFVTAALKKKFPRFDVASTYEARMKAKSFGTTSRGNDRATRRRSPCLFRPTVRKSRSMRIDYRPRLWPFQCQGSQPVR